MKYSDVIIRQADSLTHTMFVVGAGGFAFPESNYVIAKEWEKKGLLDPVSQAIMDAIAEKRKAGEGRWYDAG